MIEITKEDMGLIDQMKYSKILYLADVLEDISAELQKRRHDMRDIWKSIDGIVTDLRDTVANNVPANQIIKEDSIQIKRLEICRELNSPPVSFRDIESFEQSFLQHMEEELLHHIKKSKLIRVRKNMNDMGVMTFTASMIVGIEKDADIPSQEPQITFMDKILKYIDEDRHI